MSYENMADLENAIFQNNLASRLYYAAKGPYFTFFATLCIAGLICSYSFMEFSVTGTLITYIPPAWNKNILEAVTIISITDGLSSIFIVILTIISNNDFGPLKTILVSTFSCSVGLVMLGVSIRKSSFEISCALFVVGGVLVSIGKPVKEAVLRGVLSDQLFQEHDNYAIDEHNSSTISGWRLTKSYLCCLPCIWWNGACAFGVLFSIIFSLMSYSEILTPLDAIVTLTVLLVTGLLFWCGSPFYVPNRPARISWSTLLNVTGIEAKNLFKMLPMWAVFIVYTFVKMTSSTFFFLQNDELAGQIPGTLLFIISALSEYLCSKICRLSIIKCREKTKVLVTIGVGMTSSVLCCTIAYMVEHRRLQFDKPEIGGYWMIPLFILAGIMKSLAEGGLDDLEPYFIPQSWDACGLILSPLVLGLLKVLNIPFICAFHRWIKNNVNESRLDRYYLVLVILSVPNCLLCFYICTLYRDDMDAPIDGDMTELLENVSEEQIQTPPTCITTPQTGTEMKFRKICSASEDRSETRITREIRKAVSLKMIKYK